MKAAYKWRLQNGVYGYLTDENDSAEHTGKPFIYTVSLKEREYYNGETILGDEVDETKIAHIVSTFTEEQYIDQFADFKAMIDEEYPTVSLLDVYYYYNMENDECTESASSLKCAATDIIFTVADVKSGETAEVTIEALNTSTAVGNIEYEMSFTLPRGEQGEKGETPKVNVGEVSTTTLEPEEDASVTITTAGTETNQTLNFEFEIPRGQGVDPSGGIIVSSVTATTIESSALVTSSVTTNYIEDVEDSYDSVISRDDSDWYIIYSAATIYSTNRIGVSAKDDDNWKSEAYYIEANIGKNIDSISLLNGMIDDTQAIKQVRIAKYPGTEQYANIEVYIDPSIADVECVLNNIQGCGTPVNFIKPEEEPMSEYVIDLTKGIATKDNVVASKVITSEIQDKTSIFTYNNAPLVSVYEMPYKSTTRMAISTDYESYYIEVDAVSGVRCNLTILNGCIGSDKRISNIGLLTGDTTAKVTITSTSSNFNYYLNNVEGCGKIINEEQQSGHPEIALPTGNGLVTSNVTTSNLTASYATMNNLTVTGNTIIKNLTVTGDTVFSGGTVNMTNTTVIMPENVGLPIGSITMWAGSNSIPDGWFLCDGTPIPVYYSSETGYKTLACKIQGKNCQDDSLHSLAFGVLSGNYGQLQYYKNTSLGWVSNGNYSGSSRFVVTEWTDDASSAYSFYSTSLQIYTGTTSVETSVYEGIKLPNLQQRFPLGALQNGTIGKQGTDGTITGWSTSIGKSGGTDTQLLSGYESGIKPHSHDLMSRYGTGYTGGGFDYPSVTSSIETENYGYIDSHGGGGKKYVKSIEREDAESPHNNIPPFLAINFIIKYA